MKIVLNSNSKWFFLLSHIVNLWCFTLRMDEIFENDWGHEELIFSKEKNMIFAFWHDEFLPLAYRHRNRGFYAIVSPSRDGEILAGFLKRWGYNLIRGSSHKRPVKLLRRVVDVLRKNRGIGIAIAVDGPTGPRHKVKKGPIYLASKSGSYIVPIRVIMSRSIKLNSWDRFQIPLIGSKCSIVYGEPYLIRDSQEINYEVLNLERKLNN